MSRTDDPNLAVSGPVDDPVEPRPTHDGLSGEEQREVVESQPPRPQVLHEIIRLQGTRELNRTAAALWWSALAAGFTIGLSMLAMGLLQTQLKDHPLESVISSVGYTFGFLAVILARQQLFTENTLTAVLPLMSAPHLAVLFKTLRLWSIVLIGNMIGATLFAYAILHLPIVEPAADEAFLEIGRKVMENDPSVMFSKAVISGWMIATMVWLVPAAETGKIWVIMIITYCMAIGSFTHIVVGTAEISYLAFAGELPWYDFWTSFAIPTLAGNVAGGSLIFALISHAQVRSDNA